MFAIVMIALIQTGIYSLNFAAGNLRHGLLISRDVSLVLALREADVQCNSSKDDTKEECLLEDAPLCRADRRVDWHVFIRIACSPVGSSVKSWKQGGNASV